MSEIRYDRLHDRDVIIAPERLHRPSCDLRKVERRTTPRVCPFCEGNEVLTPPEIFALRGKDSIINKKGWKTRVVPNLYKAVQIEAPHKQHFGAFEHWEGFGAHEVVIDTPEHFTSMSEWSEDNVVNWLKTLQSRFNDLRRDGRLSYLSIFKNEGVGAGGTQPHSHTQILGLPLIPKEKKQLFERLYEYYKHNNKSLIASIIDEEFNAEQKRIIKTNGVFSAFCPYGSAHPFEIMISSQEAIGNLDSLSDLHMQELASLLLYLIKRLKKQLHCLEFNLLISTPPLQAASVGDELANAFYEAGRFYINIIPRVYNYGGFEHDSGIYINPVSPELAAKLLREG
jgi:UDPglucose--hexose-1-phosphate uridylyltransferase